MCMCFNAKYTLIIWMMNTLVLFSQVDIVNNHVDTPKNVLLDEIVLEDDQIHLNNRIHYLSLRRKVLKVYPYVDSIRQLLDEVDSNLKHVTKKRMSRRYIRRFQKKIMYKFGDNISGLTRSEGVILSKLIYREFDLTAYDLITKYRGGVHSFFWQGISKLYDGNLKSKFNPEGNSEDFFINHILLQSAY